MTALSNKFKVLIVKYFGCSEGVEFFSLLRNFQKTRDENSKFLQALKQVRNLCVSDWGEKTFSRGNKEKKGKYVVIYKSSLKRFEIYFMFVKKKTCGRKID